MSFCVSAAAVAVAGAAVAAAGEAEAAPFPQAHSASSRTDASTNVMIFFIFLSSLMRWFTLLSRYHITTLA